MSVFMIDIGGSMQPCLAALKDNVGVLMDHMVNTGPNGKAVVKDWRIRVCGFRNASQDGAVWWEEHPFSSDLAQIRADLGSLEAKGGGDEPEPLLDGLWKLAKMPSAAAAGETADGNSWRHRHDAARCVIVFTGASCHMETTAPEAAGATFDDVAREVINARLRLAIFCPEADCYQTILSIDRCEVGFVGSLSDAHEKSAEFSRNTENFEETIRYLFRGPAYKMPVL